MLGTLFVGTISFCLGFVCGETKGETGSVEVGKVIDKMGHYLGKAVDKISGK